MTPTTTRPPPAAPYRLWDWAALLGFVTGLASIVIWWIAEGQRKQSSIHDRLEGTESTHAPAVLWWLPFIIGALTAASGLGVQALLARLHLGNSRVVRAVISVVAGPLLGLTATFTAYGAMASEQPGKSSDAGAPPFLVYYIATGALGALAGFLIARHQLQRAASEE